MYLPVRPARRLADQGSSPYSCEFPLKLAEMTYIFLVADNATT